MDYFKVQEHSHAQKDSKNVHIFMNFTNLIFLKSEGYNHEQKRIKAQ